MDEQPTEDQAPETAVESPVESTGVPAVDEVLGSLHRLADLPLDEHVGVFEQAHDRLRRALDAQPDS
ncbi:hypothetical protein DDE18_20775 [Nocardioides gansuensis]|uniref:Uncharacterized protein n=1 Tax=Nocardioides gansuensis TaxID=2138300 RepID=A0A2T8F575_9ACTN|nr:hypothetical protein [Nocardioides gansuensis]PVG80830.1 hypothetical protein DDE18_20775 [Nocardioides gansuensis]